MDFERYRNETLLLARLLLAAVFLYDGWLILRAPEPTMGYLEQFGVPGALIYPALALEVVGGLLVAIGLAARPAALALGGFCVLTAMIFHHNLGDSGEAIQFGKDFGLAGGWVLLSVVGAGRFAVDAAIRPKPGRASPQPDNG